ncbi:MAG: phosphoribosylanthranilate isomerase, partial [Desulfohalobiaceae bacterium]
MITYHQTIQVAGIRSLGEARMLLAAGVDVLGFPLRLDLHAQDMTEGETAAVVQALGAPEKCLVITYEEDPEEVADLCRRLGVGGVQLHGHIPAAGTARLAELAPELV